MRCFKILLWGACMTLTAWGLLALIGGLAAHVTGLGTASFYATQAYFAIVTVAIIVAVCLQIRDCKYPVSTYSHLTAGLLAIFLGSIGAHKFYCRKYTWGIVFVFFAGTSIPFIVGVIEGVCYLLMDDERFNHSIGGTSF